MYRRGQNRHFSPRCLARPTDAVIQGRKIDHGQKSGCRGYAVSTKIPTLPALSTEQKAAVDVVVNSPGNAVVNAVAGSGKTTTILYLASATKKKVLLLVYNKRLMDETRQRASQLELKNIEIFNYHALGFQYYSPECFSDQGLKRVVQDSMKPVRKLPKFDILVLDEQQDMNPIYFNFVRKVIRDAAKTPGEQPQYMLLGDPRQEIYSYNGSDERFLTFSEKLLDNGREWHVFNARISYRMTYPIAKFINDQVLKSTSGLEIISGQVGKGGPLPRYVICDSRSDAPLEEIKRLLDSGLSPNQIMVLAPSLRSIKGETHVQHLANMLASSGIRVQVSDSDNDSQPSARVLNGKILFASYHQAKGIERDAVVLFGFDQSYHRYYDRDPEDITSAGNAQYVAATRAKTHLVLIHDYENDYLPFVNRDTLSESCEVVVQKALELPTTTPNPQPGYEAPVTTMTRHIPEVVQSQCIGLVDLTQVSEPKKRRKNARPPNEIEVEPGIWETVSDITGTAILAIYEWRSRKTCNSLYHVFQLLERGNLDRTILKYLHPVTIKILRALKQGVTMKSLDEADFLYLANISNAMQSGYAAKAISITLEKCTWLKKFHTNLVYRHLNPFVSKNASYERYIKHTFIEIQINEGFVTVTGRPDIHNPDGIIEVKYTGTFRPEHVLQLVLYAAIEQANTDTPKDRIYLLVNAQTGQVVNVKKRELPDGKDAFIEIVRLLAIEKTTPRTLRMSDAEFLDQAARGFDKVVREVTVPAWFSIPAEGLVT